MCTTIIKLGNKRLTTNNIMASSSIPFKWCSRLTSKTFLNIKYKLTTACQPYPNTHLNIINPSLTTWCSPILIIKECNNTTIKIWSKSKLQHPNNSYIMDHLKVHLKCPKASINTEKWCLLPRHRISLLLTKEHFRCLFLWGRFPK